MKKILKTVGHEVRALVPVTLFFFFALSLLMLTKRLMLAQYGIPFSDLAGAVVGALVVGKVVLIVDQLSLVNRFPNKPLIYNIAWKTVIYVAAAFIVRLAENLIPLAFKYDSIGDAVRHAADAIVWPHFWVIYIWLSVLLFVYCSLRELIRAIGKDAVLKLFFGPVSKT